VKNLFFTLHTGERDSALHDISVPNSCRILVAEKYGNSRKMELTFYGKSSRIKLLSPLWGNALMGEFPYGERK